MAYPGMGELLPAETSYRTPGAYRDVLRGEGHAKGTYLASIDQFREGLDWQKESFWADLEAVNKRFEETMRFEEEKLESGEELGWAELELRRDLGEADIGLRGRGLDIQEMLGQGELGLRGETLGMAREETEYQRGEDVRKWDFLSDYQESLGKEGSTQDLFKAMIAGLQGGEIGGPASGETVVPGAGGGEEGGTKVTSGLRISGPSGTYASGIFTPPTYEESLYNWEMGR